MRLCLSRDRKVTAAAAADLRESTTKIIRQTEGQIRFARNRCYHHMVGNKPFIKTVMRHSYGSYWLALHGEINKLSLMLGHTSTAISLKHYHKAVSKEQATKYFSIVPPV